MGREVRRVPSDWQHPLDTPPVMRGKPNYRPLFEGPWSERTARWDEEQKQWAEGFCRDYTVENAWSRKTEDMTGSYEDWAGLRPAQAEYMPDWREHEATHLMMYENTSEGTPISPALATPEELARWLTDNGASAFGDETATYEQWLVTCLSGWAPSAVLDSSGLRSGVAAMADRPPNKGED